MSDSITNQANATPAHVQYLRAAPMAKRCGVSVATFWRWTKLPTFPKALRPSSGTTLWPVDAVDAWLAGTRKAA